MEVHSPSAKPSYLKAAFANIYNLSLLGGALVASAATGEYVIGAVAIGVEALWLLLGPDFKLFQRAVDRAAKEDADKADRERVAKMMETLPEREWARAHALDELRREIEKDMAHNPSFQAILVQTEVAKLQQLHSSFVSLAAACVRAETYLGAADPDDLKKQIATQESVEKSSQDETARHIARKNIDVLKRRQDTIKEIQNFLARARGQMNLIENSVRLLRDQVLTMGSPAQLGDQLDDLITGVEAIQQTARDNDELEGVLRMEPIAPISTEDSATTSTASRVRSR